MSLDEVALALGCAKSTVYERLRDLSLGIPLHKRGSRYIVLRTEFNAWLSGQRGEPADLVAQLEEAVYRGVSRALGEFTLVRRQEDR